MSARDLVTLGRPLGASLLFAGLVLVGLGAAAASWADLSAATEERDAKAELLARGVAVSRRVEAARAAPAADPFVAGDTSTLAAAAVDSDLRALAVASGLSLLSSRAEAKAEAAAGEAGAGAAGGAGLGTRIEDQAVVEGSNEALQALLVALETGLPTMLVDDLAVEPAATEAVAAGGDAQAPRLHASLTLSAYWRPGKPPAR